MWQRKSKPVTPATRKKKRTNLFSLLVCALLLPACSREQPSADPLGTELRVAHLTDLAWQDRNQSGQPTEFMPGERFDAVLEDLNRVPADVLILRGIGSRASLQKLQQELQARYQLNMHPTYIPGPTPYEGIGFLTRSAPKETVSLSGQSYEVEGHQYHPMAGGIRMLTGDEPGTWIWNATLPEPEADYELRRNEARLLSQAVRPYLESDLPLLLSVHCREDMDSPMIRMLTDTGLVQLVAEDEKGDRWTHRDPEGRIYQLDQLLFASPALIRDLPRPPRLHEHPALRLAGEFRHQRVWLP